MVWGRFNRTRVQLGGRDIDLECDLDLEAWYPLVLALPLHEKYLGLGDGLGVLWSGTWADLGLVGL